jgi:hypothetical protein
MKQSESIRLIVLLAVSAATALPARSQETRDTFAPVMVGSRVRLFAPSAIAGRIQGTVMETNDKTLLLSTNDHQPLRVPRAAITQLELSTGRSGNPLKGALIGAGIGGALFAAVPKGDYCGNVRFGESCSGRGELIAEGLVGGALWGALFGWLIKHDRWSAVPLDPVKLSVAPTRGGGARVALTLRW